VVGVTSKTFVALRARSASDTDVLYEIAADLETWEERSPLAPAPLTRSAFEDRLANEAASDHSMRFVIEVDRAAVGSVSLFDVDDLARTAEVGIALLDSARGKGIGTEAIAQIVKFAFVRCNLRRVHLQAIASNSAALRAYEKAGFVIEGRQREHAWVRGHYEDIVVMGLLRSEWRQGRSDASGIGATR
jgi:RimJ/RimL family protein N-acetyltransferase